jgi:hypothetical protein
VSGGIKHSGKNVPKVLTDKILRQLADLAGVPSKQQKSYFDSVRANVRAACEWDRLVKGGLANRDGTILHNAALTVYDKLRSLNDDQQALIERTLNNGEFSFDRIASKGLPGLLQTSYEFARLFSLVTGKTPPRRLDENIQSRKGGRGTIKHLRYQKFICDFLIVTAAAGGKLDNNPYGGTSSLRDALNILSPYLPEGFHPKSLSLATFQRLKTRSAPTKRRR